MKQICDSCGRTFEGKVYVFGRETLCDVCNGQLGEGLDEIELCRILKDRGLEWIENFLTHTLNKFYGSHK